MVPTTDPQEGATAYHGDSPVEAEAATDSPMSENGTSAPQLSKKAAKRAAKQVSKNARKSTAAEAEGSKLCIDDLELDPPPEITFGTLQMIRSTTTTGRQWVRLVEVNESRAGEEIWIRARVHMSRCKGALGFLQLRQQLSTIQAVIDSKTESLGRAAVKWASTIPLESVVDVLGVVTKPETPVTSCSMSTVELSVRRLFLVSRASPELPFQLRDAQRSEKEMAEEGAVTVGQETRLDARVLDLRTASNQAIFRLQAAIGMHFQAAFRSHGFTEIHTPKLIAGAAEGGSSVFTLDYFGRKACLAQSPQLHKQMAICADFDRVFEICPVFRAENSNTSRHLCEFVGVDAEMAIYEHFDEILDILQSIFVSIFEQLTVQSAAEIELVRHQYGGEPLVWLPAEETPRIMFEEAVEMLRSEGIVDPVDDGPHDLTPELERELSILVKRQFGTDFFVVFNYPLETRPFYTMPSYDYDGGTNSYDFFLRGEEILSGAQRIHDPELLTRRAAEAGVPLESIRAYVDSFRLGAFPHGGCGIGLERVLMNFLGLNNIRKTSLFPRDPKRLSP